MKLHVATPGEIAEHDRQDAAALDAVTEELQTLVVEEWKNTLAVGRLLNQMVEQRLWRFSPAVMDYIEKTKQNPGGEALLARHLNAHGIAITRQRAGQLIAAAQLVRRVEGATRVAPSSEKQVRPLVTIRPQPSYNDLAKLWNEAVELADGKQPTATQVREVVNKHHPKPVKDKPRLMSRAEQLF